MSNFKRAMPAQPGGRSTGAMSSPFNVVQMEDSRAALPAEIMETILDFLSISDLFSFARTSRRMQEMVYDDTRWVRRLRSMGVWNESEARKRFEDGMRRKWEAQRQKAETEARTGIGVNGMNNGTRKTSTTLFDAGIEEERQARQNEMLKVLGNGRPPSMSDGFETLSLNAATPTKSQQAIVRAPLQNPEEMLKVFENVKSTRGNARQEYGRIYATLAPFYFDLARSRSHSDPVIFRVYREPEQQAKMLAQLHRFAQSDWSQSWLQREERLNNMIGIFENAVLREFEQGYELGDVDGTMHRYAHVLDILNGGHACIDLFVQKHALFSERTRAYNALDCINQAPAGSVTLEPSREFLAMLSTAINDQTSIANRVFPQPGKAVNQFLEKVGEDVLSEYITPLFDGALETSKAAYLKAVSGVFVQSRQFATTLVPPRDSASPEEFLEMIDSVIGKVFDPHVDTYLQEELDFFRREAESQVSLWEKKLVDEDASTESYFMANVNRQADKKDFLSSFKKVVMMPVNVLPTLPITSPFGTKTNATTLEVPNGSTTTPTLTPLPSRPHSPGSELPPSPGPGPTNELAAKAAIMASRLEGIKSLFSIEIALMLVHAAKTSLERAQHFIKLGGQNGEEAREQCEQLFVVMLQFLGSRHVQPGFDKAVDHLSNYKAREVSEHQKGVAPLVTFLELVNVGDLISQMIDVFYEQQLCAPRIADKNDFLDPAVKAKKKFEQMLDERVAAGMNKGIDVLIDEVEYLTATLQLPTDYNPRPMTTATSATGAQDFAMGPTSCTQRVVELVSSHTKMLVGSTDKGMLDVFNQEVGLRLFTALCKHLKRQRISTEGAINLISDMNVYYTYIQTLKNSELLVYYRALRELSQIYLIGGEHAKDMAAIIADGERFKGIFRAEEVYEFAERRADWYVVKPKVERAMYGYGCAIM